MNIIEHITNVRPASADLADFEHLICGTLPDDYRTFLKTENGGRPKPNRFQFLTKDGKKEESTVHYFFALYDGRVGGIKKTLDRYRNRIVAGYLPIAIDPFGNLIILGFADQNKMYVCFWDHEKEAELPNISNIYVIARSFSEFVQQLI